MGYVDNPVECEHFKNCNNVENRNFYCNHYDNCLLKAVENNWSNFSCKQCWKFKYKESMRALYVWVNCASVITYLTSLLYSKKID